MMRGVYTEAASFPHYMSAVSLPMSDLFNEIETFMRYNLLKVVYGANSNCSALSKML